MINYVVSNLWIMPNKKSNPEILQEPKKKTKCKVCNCVTTNGFNIDFKLVPICEGCATAITFQQMSWYTEQNNNHKIKS